MIYKDYNINKKISIYINIGYLNSWKLNTLYIYIYIYIYTHTILYYIYIHYAIYWTSRLSVHQWPGRPGYTKDSKNGT